MAAPSRKPATIERRQRLQRAKQRQATGAPAGAPAQDRERNALAVTNSTKPPIGRTAAPMAPDDWLALRAQFQAAIKTRQASHAQAAAQLAVSKASVTTWLAPNGKPPSAANIAKIRAWLTPDPPPAPAPDGEVHQLEGAAVWPALRANLRDIVRGRGVTHAELARVLGVATGTFDVWVAGHEPGPTSLNRIRRWLADGAVIPAAAPAGQLYTLSEAEQAQLAGHISLAGNGRELRERFGATPELLQKAASGGHLAAEIVTKLRTALAGNGADAG